MASLSSFFEDNVRLLTESFPLIHLETVKSICYGTAGFRCVHEWLPPISARVVLIALIRSIALCKERTKKSQSSVYNSELKEVWETTMGVMITASHNPCGDNGMKIIDLGGEMLDSILEPWCTHAANANDAVSLTRILCECCEALCISRDELEKYIRHVTFFMGRDTRPSGNAIVHAMQWVLIDLFHVHCIDFGVVTTPQLHFYVSKAHDLCVLNKHKSVNSNADVDDNHDDKVAGTYATEIEKIALQLYNNTISNAFTKLLSFANTVHDTEEYDTNNNKVKQEKQAITDKEVKCDKQSECTHVQSNDNNTFKISIINSVGGAKAASASNQNKCTSNNVINLVVDASNGVGSIALRQLSFVLNSPVHESTDNTTHNESGNTVTTNTIKIHKRKEQYVSLHMVNCHTESPDMLNHLCGADYAKLTGQPSREMLNYQCHATISQECKNEMQVNDANTLLYTHFYCLDGDADRLIGFYRTECHLSVQNDSCDKNVKDEECCNKNNDEDDDKDSKNRKCTWHIIDGDRIAILYATLLRTWLGPELLHDLQIAIVQTAYANGATRKYIEDVLHFRSIVTATGVKHLHKAAKEVDIGIYFEANGHGTILFNMERCTDVIRQASYLTEDEKKMKLQMLTALSQLASQVCGDAIADMLLCEVAFKALQLTPNDIIGWYDEFPAIQVKVRVPDPSIVTTTADEQHALTPIGLQSAIDDAVRSIQEQFCNSTSTDKHSSTRNSDINNKTMPNKLANKTAAGKIHARAFVRPSGTEPIVRVYCEASRQDACEQLSGTTVEIVNRYCM